MRRTLNWIRWAHVLALLWLLAAPTDLRAGAQAERRSLVPGDPPVAGLIAISGPDADGFVEVSGAQRSVFPNAQVGIRNLYTYETVYVRAGVFGNFTARLRATPGAPLAIVPVASVPPPEARFYPGSLPGGPGTIVYVPQGPAPTPSTGLPLVIDADLADWNRIPLTRLARGGDHSLYAVRGAQSLYLALAASLDSGARADIRQIAFTLRGGGAFFITFERDARGTLLPAAIVSSTINRTERGLISASAWRADDAGGFAFEARLPLTTDIFRLPAETLALESVILTDEAGAELARFASGAPIPERSDVDAYYGVDGLRAGRAEAVSFAVAGTLNRAESYWTAAGRISTLNPERGAPLRLELDVELRGELDPAHLPAARLTLVPIALREQPGAPALAIPAAYTNNGWSNQSIAGGVAIDNLTNDQPLAEIVVPYGRIWRGRSAAGETVLRFPLDFDLTLPDPLADGLYTLRFEGGVRAPDGTFTRWEDWAGFRLAGGWTTFGAPAEPITWVPVVLNFGGVDETRLPLALLADDGADGARGILAQQDADLFALSNRTRFATSELVLAQSERGPSGATPRVYPLEPYLPNLLPNRSDTAAAPLIPFDLTTGTWTVTVTRPDGTTETLGTFPLTQLVFSTAARDDRTLFGPSAPVDMARLSAVADAISAYVFNQPGRYTIQATGSIRDIYGNLYTGGGSYSVIAGEPLDLLPAAPPGVPLQIGDRLPLGVRVTPATPAEIAVELAIIDQDGRITTRRLTGRANPAGLFLPAGDDAVYTADRPGIYSVTYRAQYAAPDGRLWIG
ncbi:MAG: hypothetical protein NZM00_12940, partial [Anaerolinea sp.]|nr:hypothetical protein [Anaerolinea sp.]